MDTSCDTSCHGSGGQKKDYFFITIMVLGVLFYLGHLLNMSLSFTEDSMAHLFHSFYDVFNVMFLGIILGIIFVGVLGKIPREYITSVLGKPHSKMGVFRAALAGLALDLCSHGILMVGMQLYKKGASLGQVMSFLIASPWNSLSLTVILISLIGIKWTLAFIFLSWVIAIISGFIFDALEKKKILPMNPNQAEIREDFHFWQNIKKDLKAYSFSVKGILELLIAGVKDSKIIIKWVIFGALLSSFINVFVDQELFQQYFGPTLLGLITTLFFTTILEVCSEGATPLAADIMNRASAPGNSFTFLMAGVSTDYTEVMSIKETTKSWKIAFFLPLVTVPQILIIGLLLNGMASSPL